MNQEILVRATSKGDLLVAQIEQLTKELAQFAAMDDTERAEYAVRLKQRAALLASPQFDSVKNRVSAAAPGKAEYDELAGLAGCLIVAGGIGFAGAPEFMEAGCTLGDVLGHWLFDYLAD